MADSFDPIAFKIATDAMVAEGFEEAAKWMRRRIDDEVDRLALRKVTIDRVLREAFGPIELTSDLYQDVKAWLHGRPRLLRGLSIRFDNPDDPHLDSTTFTMSVKMCGRAFASPGSIYQGQDRSIRLEVAYSYLIGSYDDNLALV
jgi:hypothetical protein